ncbi:MAG: septum formation protein Maf [Clostridia bacterium]|nr:septum formation protein Maf [Clostridia bacterium]
MDWILASASPRRKELFRGLIAEFDIIPARGEEKDEGLREAALVKALAAQKAREVAALPQAANKAVLGADTIVALDGETLGKPCDERDAARMLRALSGREHQVYTGVCISVPTRSGARKEYIDAAETSVRFYDLSEEQIAAYIKTGSPMDKAGAYGIQDGGLVESLNGSYSNVVGLPLELLEEMLRQID